jgi:hypothetical protein
MLAPFKQLLWDFRSIVTNMYNKLPFNLIVTTNYELLCNVETIMGLTYTMPMLEAMQNLSKLTQNRQWQ